MASYDSFYELPAKSGMILRMVSAALNGSDYVMYPNRRGMKFADLTQDCDVQFTKAFWSINEHPTIRVMRCVLNVFVCLFFQYICTGCTICDLLNENLTSLQISVKPL